MERQLRVGVIGAGHWATQAHIPGFQACEGVAVVAVCDASLARAGAAAETHGIEAVYASAEAMLAQETLDLVSIVTPDDTHTAYATAALAAGIPVLCEKPLARTADEARSLADLARTAAVQTKVGFTMRYAPAVQRLRELVVDGDLGQPYLFQCFIQNGQFLDPAKPRHWKMTLEHAGGGAMVEYGIHALDIARWTMGDITRVSASGRTLIPERPSPDGKGVDRVDVDDSCAWLMDFANGALGSGHAGWATIGRAPGFELRVYGSRGAAQVVLSDDLPGSQMLRVATAADQSFLPVEIPERLATPLPLTAPWYRRFHHNLIRHFIEEVRTQKPGLPSFEEGARAQAALEAVLTAMADGRWVSIA